MPRRSDTPDPLLVAPPGQRVAFLLDAATDFEVRLMDRWLTRQLNNPAWRRLKSSRRGRSTGDDLVDLLTSDDVLLVPVRVVWMAPDKDGRRSVGWSDAIKPGDPRDPRGLRARYIRTFRPGRV